MLAENTTGGAPGSMAAMTCSTGGCRGSSTSIGRLCGRGGATSTGATGTGGWTAGGGGGGATGTTGTGGGSWTAGGGGGGAKNGYSRSYVVSELRCEYRSPVESSWAAIDDAQ